MQLLLVLLIVLTPSAPTSGEVTNIYGRLAGGSTLLNPGIDTYSRKCASVTTLRARAIVQPGSLDTIHVTTVCVDPLVRRNTGDSEIAQDPERRVSEWSEATQCREASLIVTCECNSSCNDEYRVQVECVNSAFLPPLGGPILNR